MAQLMVIVGMGTGNGMAIARRFAREGFAIAMIARNQGKLETYQTSLKNEGFDADYFIADAGNKEQMQAAFAAIQKQLGTPDILTYNAGVPRMENVLETSFESLIDDFHVNVAGALVAVQAILPQMQTAQKTGTILFTGGGFALYPQPDFASLSIGKAGLRSLAHTLGMALKPQGIKVGIITITGMVDEADPKYNPTAIAEEYWQFYSTPQSEIEIVY